MNLYLDDDTADRQLVAPLASAGHTVFLPSDANLSGATDARHFVHAIRNELILVTRNHDDFVDLHEVVQAAAGVHSGILVVRFDKDRSRDITRRQIVTAIGNLDSAGVPLEKEVYILNHWR